MMIWRNGRMSAKPDGRSGKGPRGPRTSRPVRFRGDWESHPPIPSEVDPRAGRCEGYVYVVRFLEWVKVGFTTKPKRRCYLIQQNLPGQIDVLYVVRAVGHVEVRLLAALSRWRAQGEWFVASPGCMEAIRAHMFGSARQ